MNLDGEMFKLELHQFSLGGVPELIRHQFFSKFRALASNELRRCVVDALRCTQLAASCVRSLPPDPRVDPSAKQERATQALGVPLITRGRRQSLRSLIPWRDFGA